MSETTKCEAGTIDLCGREDHESCSWCLSCGPDDDLRENFDGARVCEDCQQSPDFWGDFENGPQWDRA